MEGDSDAVGGWGWKQRDPQLLLLLTPCQAAAIELPEALQDCGLGSTAKQSHCHVTQTHSSATLRNVARSLLDVSLAILLSGLPQVNSSSAVHQVIGAGEEAEGMGDYDVAVVSHVRDTGSPLPIGDMQDFTAVPQ